DDPGVFGPVAAHPATETALVAAYRELRDCSEAALDGLAGCGPRAADVVRLCRAARARLARDWYDEQDLIGAAVAALEAGGGDALALGAVIAYLPERLPRHVVELLAATAGALGLTVVAGTTGDVRADAEVTSSIAALAECCDERSNDAVPAAGAVGAAVERLPVVGPDRTRFVTVSDADDEVRAVVRAIVDAVREGTPLDRLAAAGIPADGAAVTPVAARAAGRTLLGLLALPEAGFRRQDVFAWLAGAPILHRGRFAP